MSNRKSRCMLVFLALCRFLKPSYVLLENVPNMMSTDVPKIICNYFNEMNYKVAFAELSAVQYGLPQIRNRVIVWACDSDKELPNFPPHTHAYKYKTMTPKNSRYFLQIHPSQNKEGASLPGTSLQDFITDLPMYDGKGKKKDKMDYTSNPLTRYQAILRELEPYFDRDKSKNTLTSHDTPTLNVENQSLIEALPRQSGANAYNYVSPHMWENFTKGVVLSRPIQKLLTRASWSRPINTLITHLDVKWAPVIHPYAHRSFTAREAARCQGFADSFKFSGKTKHIIRQIGNSVPINISDAIAMEFIKTWIRDLNFVKQQAPFGSQADLEVIVGVEPCDDEPIASQGNNIDKLIARYAWPNEKATIDPETAQKHLNMLCKHVPAHLSDRNPAQMDQEGQVNRERVDTYLTQKYGDEYKHAQQQSNKNNNKDMNQFLYKMELSAEQPVIIDTTSIEQEHIEEGSNNSEIRVLRKTRKCKLKINDSRSFMKKKKTNEDGS
jgi:site-specific DNA-cytosine methylase